MPCVSTPSSPTASVQAWTLATATQLPFLRSQPRPVTSHHYQSELSKPFCGSLLPTRGPYHILHTALQAHCLPFFLRTLGSSQVGPKPQNSYQHHVWYDVLLPIFLQSPYTWQPAAQAPLLCRALCPRLPWLETLSPSHAPASCAHLHLLYSHRSPSRTPGTGRLCGPQRSLRLQHST